MNEVLFALLGLLVAFNIGHFMTLRKCEEALKSLRLEAESVSSFDPSSIMENLRTEVGDLVQDVLENMRPPTIADHLGGVVAQFAQMKMMQQLQDSGLMAPGPDALTMEHESGLD